MLEKLSQNAEIVFTFRGDQRKGFRISKDVQNMQKDDTLQKDDTGVQPCSIRLTIKSVVKTKFMFQYQSFSDFVFQSLLLYVFMKINTS